MPGPEVTASPSLAFRTQPTAVLELRPVQTVSPSGVTLFRSSEQAAPFPFVPKHMCGIHSNRENRTSHLGSTLWFMKRGKNPLTQFEFHCQPAMPKTVASKLQMRKLQPRDSEGSADWTATRLVGARAHTWGPVPGTRDGGLLHFIALTFLGKTMPTSEDPLKVFGWK